LFLFLFAKLLRSLEEVGLKIKNIRALEAGFSVRGRDITGRIRLFQFLSPI